MASLGFRRTSPQGWAVGTVGRDGHPRDSDATEVTGPTDRDLDLLDFVYLVMAWGRSTRDAATRKKPSHAKPLQVHKVHEVHALMDFVDLLLTEVLNIPWTIEAVVNDT